MTKTATIQTPEGSVTAKVVSTPRSAGSWQWQSAYGFGIRPDSMARCLSGTVVGKIAQSRSRKNPHGPARGWEAEAEAALQEAEDNLHKLSDDPKALGQRVHAELCGAARRAASSTA